MALRSRVSALVLAVFIALSLVTMVMLPLHLDEADYWNWATYPDLSYLDHPPMVAWLIALSTAVGGDGEFFVRIGGFLLLWVGFAFAFLTMRELFPDAPAEMAWETLLVLNLTIIFAGATLVMTIDTPLFAFWFAALYFGARVVRRQEGKAWYGLGLCLGLGMLSKYTMVLLAAAMLLFVLLAPSHRHWLGRKEPWLGALLALLVFSPVLIWNLQHDWASFRFQLHHGFQPDANPWWDKLLGFVGEQAGIVSPFLFLAFLVYGLRAIPLAARPAGLPYLYLVLMSWPVILFFAVSSVLGPKAEGNWPAPAYAAGLMSAWAVYWGHFAARPAHRRFMAVVLVVSLLLSLLARTHLVWHWLPIPPTQDRLYEFVGWPRLGAKVERLISDNPHAEGYFLASDVETRLAEALYYTGGRYVGIDFTSPERYLFLDNPNQDLKGKNAIVLTYGDSPRPEIFRPYFRDLLPLGHYQHEYKGTEIRKLGVTFYLGREFLGNWEAFDQWR